MKKHWKVDVWIDEVLEGWSADEQPTREEVENEVSKAIRKAYALIQDAEFVDCKAYEEEPEEEASKK